MYIRINKGSQLHHDIHHLYEIIYKEKVEFLDLVSKFFGQKAVNTEPINNDGSGYNYRWSIDNPIFFEEPLPEEMEYLATPRTRLSYRIRKSVKDGAELNKIVEHKFRGVRLHMDHHGILSHKIENGELTPTFWELIKEKDGHYVLIVDSDAIVRTDVIQWEEIKPNDVNIAD